MSEPEIAAFEKVLNDELHLGVNIAWKTEKRPALVLSGKYKSNPKSEKGKSESSSYEGSFGILARRSHVVGTAGTYDDFKQAIGEVLMLPVVDEAELRPAKTEFVRMHGDTPVLNSDRLPPEL